nr:hypothetical protein [Desulfobacteraceae bacterium]
LPFFLQTLPVMMKDKPFILETLDSFFEQKKNEFLAALYRKDFQEAAGIHGQIFQYATAHPEFNENTEKCIHQIQTALRKYRKMLISQGPASLRETGKSLKTLLTRRIRKMHRNIRHVEFDEWKARLGLTPDQENLVFKTAMTFQLTSGCSNFCRRCNEWALPGVRSHFSYPAVIRILNRIKAAANPEISLYGASDPLDWEDKGKNVADLIDQLDDLSLEYSVLTKVPRGKECLFTRMVKSRSNLSVSITSKNKARIQRIEERLDSSFGKQHDMDELLIPAGLDEDFVTVKPSITDGYGTEITPDGAFIIIPAFTSALYPQGHKKIPITGATNFFPLKKTGRTALLVDYFKPLEGYDLHQNHCHLPVLLDVQVESLILDNGSNRLTPPGMRSLKEYFFIFDEKARLQRKKLGPTVLRNLKKQFLSETSFKELPIQTRTLYQKKINTHLDLCELDKCLAAKLHAVSFFLDAVSVYRMNNPVKVEMMLFFLENEKAVLLKTLPWVGERHLEELISDPDTDVFKILRCYIIRLLEGVETHMVDSFLASHPAEYDPLGDMFINCT